MRGHSDAIGVHLKMQRLSQSPAAALVSLLELGNIEGTLHFLLLPSYLSLVPLIAEPSRKSTGKVV